MTRTLYNVIGLELRNGQYFCRAAVRGQGIAEARRAARSFRGRGYCSDVVIEKLVTYDYTHPIIPIEHWRYVPKEHNPLRGFWKKLTCDGTPL